MTGGLSVENNSQYNNHYVIIGYTASDTDRHDLIAARYTNDGKLDGSFGNNGHFLHVGATSSENFTPMDIAELNDGRLIITGQYAGHRGFLMMLTSQGQLDTSFADNGILLLGTESDFMGMHSVAVDEQNRIVAGGWQFTSTTDFYLVRVDSAGNFDTTFNGTGVQLLDLEENLYEAINRVEMFGSQIMVVGYHNNQAVIARFNDNGSLDTDNFNSPKGFIALDANPDSSANFDQLFDLVSDNDDVIYASGYSSLDSVTSQIVVSIDPNGTVNSTFANNGVGRYTFGAGNATQGIDMDQSGKLVLTGRIDEGTDGGSDIYIARLLTNGTQDPNFNNGNHVVINFGEQDSSEIIGVTPSGGLIVAGHNTITGYSTKVWYALQFKLEDPCVETLIANNIGNDFNLQLDKLQRACRPGALNTKP